MIENGTKVQVNMDNVEKQAVITLLNDIGGTIVKELHSDKTRIGYLVAYDAKHITEIDRAIELDADNDLGKVFFHTLGQMHTKEFPGDPRYYLLAFESEVKPA